MLLISLGKYYQCDGKYPPKEGGKNLNTQNSYNNYLPQTDVFYKDPQKAVRNLTL